MRVAYSTAADGDQRDPVRREEFVRRLFADRRLVVPRQVHGIGIGDDGTGDLSAADGVVTADPLVAIGAYGADCPGVVLAAPDALGIAHCGWRGTAGGMVPELVRALAARSRHPPTAWTAFIGPGIGGPRYEVDAPVLTARTWPPAALAPAARAGHAHLDLATALAADLRTAGVSAVQVSGVCTATDPRLHSFRHRGAGVVQVLVAWRE